MQTKNTLQHANKITMITRSIVQTYAIKQTHTHVKKSHAKKKVVFDKKSHVKKKKTTTRQKLSEFEIHCYINFVCVCRAKQNKKVLFSHSHGGLIGFTMHSCIVDTRFCFLRTHTRTRTHIPVPREQKKMNRKKC